MSTSGDRHLRAEPSGKLKNLIAGPRTVRVRASASYARSFAGQSLLQLLINLLGRQFGVIDAVALDIPPAPVDRRAFPLPTPEHDDVFTQLLALGKAVSGDEVRFEADNGVSPAVITVLVGPGLAPATDTLVAYGDGWDAFCSTGEHSPQTAGTSLVPFGPLLAACFAAGAVFRRFYQVTTTGTSDTSLWSFARGAWCGDSGAADLDGIRLPPAHLIGLGAVGAAFALSLAMSPGLAGTLIGIDPQTTDETGRNRLLSACHDEIGRPKVALAARLFERTGIDFYANKARWPEYAADPQRTAPAEVRREEDAFRFAWVISCVDRNLHRQNIARYLPRYVLSGSTDGLVAQATYYSMDGPAECLACNHPIPTFSMEDMVQDLQGLSPSGRLARYAAWELPPAAQAAIDDYLHNPSCGQAAEADLRRLGVDGTTDWSVGFVSAAAGVMLAAYLVRCARHGVAAAIDERPERRLIFLNTPEFSRSHARRKSDCPVCGNANARDRYRQKWSHHAP